MRPVLYHAVQGARGICRCVQAEEAPSVVRYGVRRQAKRDAAFLGFAAEFPTGTPSKAASRFACRRTPYFFTDRVLTCQAHRFADYEPREKWMDGWTLVFAAICFSSV